ncbi:MAG: SsrA-binding protein SmpB [Bacteroidales bacterium]|jgi:SsrA-binding protein|nr:SsrA-binding protein SmpB [Bacteroidales bacterium]
MGKRTNDIKIKNKRAEFEYFFLEKFTAGLVLRGTEIKSIRDGKANITDAYCAFFNNELFVKNMHIAEYRFGTYLNHQPKADRKLLLTKKELRKLELRSKDKGLTIIPSLLYIDERGYAKLNIALAKGKKAYDKRETIKEKDLRREMSRKDSD